MTTQIAATSVSRTAPSNRSRAQLSAAVTLIAVGAGTLAVRGAGPGAGPLLVFVLGVAFATAFALTRRYGLLVPGGILTGLGAGIVVSQQIAGTDQTTAAIVVLGLGLGFLSIWVIGSLLRVADSHWWPLVPGGILALIGGALLVGGEAVQVLDYWPLVLIGLGIVVLQRAWVGTRGRISDVAGR
jgi:hypothetical protein